jgi:hypothetical protein
LLAEPPAPVADDRPRFLYVATPRGTVRIRRMPSPQLYTQIKLLEAVGVLTPDGWRPAATREQLMEISRFLQRCLVDIDRDVLVCPGERGLREVLTWSADRRRELAAIAAQFMEI